MTSTHTNPDPTLEAARQDVLEARREIRRFTDLKRTASGTQFTRACVMLEEWTQRERQRVERLGTLLLIQDGFSRV